MFEPSYKISNDLLSAIVGLERSRAVLEIVPVPSDWEVRLKNDGLVRRIHACLRVYGNQISSPDIEKIVADDPGRDEKAEEVAKRIGIVAKEKDIQMVLNFLNAGRYKDQLGYLAIRFKQTGFGEKDLVQLNTLLMEKLVTSRSLGVFRVEEKAENWVGNGRVTCPNAVEVPYQLEDFFGWFLSANERQINPLIKAGICLRELMRIQPFENGNLLAGVMFTNMYLVSAGFDFKGLWIWEEELLRNKEILIGKMFGQEEGGVDLTPWLEYFVGGLTEAAVKLKNKAITMIGGQPVFRSETGKAIALSERQIAIMEDLTIRGETTIKDVRSILPSVSEDTVLRDLKDLIEKRLVKKKGRTRGARYALGKVRYMR